MSTRSRIGFKTEKGTIESVYCHCDGYPAYNGKLLLNYYNSLELAKQIVELGDISSLGKTLKQEDTCSYNRWRNENTIKRIDKNKAEYKKKYGTNGEEYIYLFENGKWYVYDDVTYTKFTLLETIEECKEV